MCKQKELSIYSTVSIIATVKKYNQIFIFIISQKKKNNINYGYLLEDPHGDVSNVYLQQTFFWRIREQLILFFI